MEPTTVQVTADTARADEVITKTLLKEVSKVARVADFWQHRQQDTESSYNPLGFRSVNHGYGSYCLGVAEHPDLPQRVYKMACADPQYDPYILYAEWVFENRLFEDNPHFPRINSISYSEDGDIALVCMEKLEEFNVDIAAEWQRYDALLYKHLTRSTVFGAPPGDYKNRPLETACQMIVDVFEEHPNVHFDSHYGNIMLRDDTLVLIDPISLA